MRPAQHNHWDQEPNQPVVQRNNNAQVDYPERHPNDLIDEDKRPYAKRRLIQTLAGGLRIVYDETGAKSIHPILYLAQAFVYLEIPICVILVRYLVDPKTQSALSLQIWLPQLIAAAVVTAVNWPLLIASFQMSKKEKPIVDEEEEKIALCSQISFQFFVHPRSSVLELLWAMLLTTAVTFLACTDPSWQVFTVSFFSCYSLLGEPIPETTPYLTNGNFHILSPHYQRVYYIIIFQIPKLFLAATYKMYFDWALVAALVLQVMSMLGNPFVLLLYLMEQFEIFGFGGSARASDLRIFLFFSLNVGLVLVAFYSTQTWLIPVLGYIASNNLWWDFGTVKPFHIVNEQLMQSKALVGIVFADLKSPVGVPAQSKCQISSLIIIKIVELCLVIGLAFLVKYTTVSLDIIKILWPICIGVQAIIYLLSSLQKRVIFRVIKCANLQKNALRHICTVLRKISTFIQTYILIALAKDLPVFTILYYPLIIYRSVNRCFTNPAASAVEIGISMLYSGYTQQNQTFFIALPVIQFSFDRLCVLINKLIYLLVSAITAFKNKKQRIKHQAACFAITGTILLPYWFLVLIYTTVLDIPTIPFLGFAFFISGYPKPQRTWSAVAPVQPSPKDAISDGHLYQNMLPQLQNQISKLILEDPNPSQWQCGCFYLLKNEKMIILIQILERGNDYVLFTLKGAELQETTVCHAEENAAINDITESVFEQSKFSDSHFPFSLSPVKQIQFSLYDDIKFSLTGTIDYPDLQPVVKNYFMRILAVKLNRIQNASQQFPQILKSNLSEMEVKEAKRYSDKLWLKFINVGAPRPSAQSPVSGVIQMQELPKADTVKSKRELPKADSWDNEEVVVRPSVIKKKEEQKVQPKPEPKKEEIKIQPKPREEVFIKPQEQLKVYPKTQQKLPVTDEYLEEIESMLNEGQPKVAVPAKKQISNQKSKIVPQFDDLDDLEDMLDNVGKKKIQTQAPVNLPFIQPPAKQRRVIEQEIDEMWEGGSSEEELPQKQQRNSRIPTNSTSSEVKGIEDFEAYLVQSFVLLFRDKVSGFPLLMQNIFNGKIQQNLDSADFLRSQDVNVLRIRYAILYSARLALHIAIDKFLMGEMDMPSNEELKELIESEDGQWFLGGEEFLWNSAIERCLPKLERIISKKGQQFMHKLQYGNNKESKFTVFEFRREVARGIWGNLNMELLFYTNANDERFSIQAEKDILRNLLVQLAEIPLGYPVFASGAKQLFF